MGEQLGTVQQVWRYPVKSLQGERLTGAAVEPRGLDGDRAWAVITRDGKLGSGKDTRRFERVDGLLDVHARTHAGHVHVGRGDDEAQAGSLAADQLLSRLLGRDVELGREDATPHHDDGAVHLVTTSSLAWLAARLSAEAVDVRRFRPNLVLDTGPEPDRVEQAWIGRRIRVGGTTLEITHATVRCRMVTLAQPAGIDHDPRVLRQLSQDNDADLGVYARVIEPGDVAEEDDVTVV